MELPLEVISPLYTVRKYNDQIYKVTKFKSQKLRVRPAKPDTTPDHKPLESYEVIQRAVSRSRRMVTELALCNQWDWFCTFTLDKKKYDRFDLDKFRKDFTQWIRDQRKKYGEIRFLLVPEQHKDGAWHMHGLLSGDLPLISFQDRLDAGDDVPVDLASGGFYSWPEYEKKFGFCSLGEVKNGVAVAFYISKYISKQLDFSAPGMPFKHRYFVSRGLEKTTVQGEVYEHSRFLDGFLTDHYQFCSVGMTTLDDGLNWTFAMEYMDCLPLDSIQVVSPPPLDEDPFEYVQCVISSWR